VVERHAVREIEKMELEKIDYAPRVYKYKMPIKTVKYSNEPVYVNADGTLEPYLPSSVVTHRDAYSKSIHMLFKHVADFHVLLVEIISEKTGLDSVEIIKQIQEDERMKAHVDIPTIYSLGLVEKTDVEKKVDVEVNDLVNKMEAVSVEPPKKRKYVKRVVKPSNTE